MTGVEETSASGTAGGGASLRPMTSQFNWALLGLVIRRPGYGYDLARRFERDYGDVLPLSYDSHVYMALAELERRGLIEATSVTGPPSSRTGLTPRPGYRATEHGSRSYRAWLLTKLEESQRSWLLFVRMLGVLAPEPEAALEIIERYRLNLLAEAAKGPTRRSPEERESTDQTARLIRRLSEEGQRAVSGRMLDWVDYARREFEALADKQG
jgi:DNA-binding PadR family transcriptional regulator